MQCVTLSDPGSANNKTVPKLKVTSPLDFVSEVIHDNILGCDKGIMVM